MKRRPLLAPAAACALALLAAAPSARADGGVRRHALVVGANTGEPGDVPLKFAEEDAGRIAKALRDVGDFGAEDVLLLTDTDADGVRRALIGMNTRLRDEPGPSLLFVFYSGHADATSLHLSGTRMEARELRDLVYGSSADARVLVLDACRSGSITRTKGGTPGAGFSIDLQSTLAATGIAVLTSSAEDEDAQESDRLGASFFTHFLVSAMLGAADRDEDGKVTLGESFAYASERTLVATTGTAAGPQHPTFRWELGGQGDLVLTEPGRARNRFGSLELQGAGSVLVQRGSQEGIVVAEATSDGGARRLALAAGTYFVTVREPRRLLEGRFSVEAGATTTVDRAAMREVAYARLVRKGGANDAIVWSPFAMIGMRGNVHNLGAAVRGEAGARADLRTVSLELRAGGGESIGTIRQTAPGGQTVTLDVEAREIAVTAGAFRVIDLGRGSVGVGGELGGIRLDRRPIPRFAPLENRPETQTTLGFVMGPFVQGEVRVWRGLHVRGDLGIPVYIADPIDLPQRHNAATQFQGTWRVSAGAGISF